MSWDDYEALLFDLDGVLTPTAAVHQSAWSAMFNAFLTDRGAEPAYTDADYFTYVDGKSRLDGIRSFLASRSITLPEGSSEDPPDADTVAGLGNRKNAVFTQTLVDDGVQAYPGSLRFVAAVERAGKAMAVVSSSRNAESVLLASGLRTRFAVLVDGEVAAELTLPGKPAPDTYELAAQMLGVKAAHAVVVEDAISGVAAGRAGNFGLVVGVDRGVGKQTLLEAGADVVVQDLAELIES